MRLAIRATFWFVLALYSAQVWAGGFISGPALMTDPEGFVLENGQVVSKTTDGDLVLLGLWPIGVPAPFDGSVLSVTCPVFDPSAPDLHRRLLGRVCELLEVGDVAYEWNGFPPDPDSEHREHYRLISVILGTPVLLSTVFADGFEPGDVSAWSSVEPPMS